MSPDGSVMARSCRHPRSAPRWSVTASRSNAGPGSGGHAERLKVDQCNRLTICSSATSRRQFSLIAANRLSPRSVTGRFATASCPAGCAPTRNSRATICAAPTRSSSLPLTAVERLDRLARDRHGKRVIHLAVRGMVDQGITAAPWGVRHPDQSQPVEEVGGRSTLPPRPKPTRSLMRPSPIRSARNSWHRRRGPDARQR